MRPGRVAGLSAHPAVTDGEVFCISSLKIYVFRLNICIFSLEMYISSLEIQLFTQLIHFSNGRPEEISPQSSLFQITPAGFVPGRRLRIPDKAPPLPHKLRKSKSSPDFPDMSHFYITFVL